MTTIPATGHARRDRWIVVAPAVLAAVTVAFGIYTRSTKGTLGTVAPPFVAGWLPQVDVAGALVAALASIGVVVLGRLLVVDRRLPPPAVAAALFLLALGAGVALNVAREGTTGLSAIYD
ncbi:MAG: hypothetical protein AAGC46_14090, partial [Solirubrobacteraceae bacterium]